MSQNEFFCKDCPNWDVNTQLGHLERDGIRIGQCRAALPVLMTELNITFPVTKENDWCRPGINLMYDLRNPAPQQQAPQKEYDEL